MPIYLLRAELAGRTFLVRVLAGTPEEAARILELAVECARQRLEKDGNDTTMAGLYLNECLADNGWIAREIRQGGA